MIFMIFLAGCSIPRGIPVPFNDGGGFSLCSTLPNGKGAIYGTDEAGGCPYPLINPWKTNRTAWCELEPAEIVNGDPGCTTTTQRSK